METQTDLMWHFKSASGALFPQCPALSLAHNTLRSAQGCHMSGPQNHETCPICGHLLQKPPESHIKHKTTQSSIEERPLAKSRLQLESAGESIGHPGNDFTQ